MKVKKNDAKTGITQVLTEPQLGASVNVVLT